MSMWQLRLDALLRVIWWASITALGFWVVPMLFATLPTPAMAGQMAAKLFEQQAWIGMVCALALLALHRPKVAQQQGLPISAGAKATVALSLIALFAILVVQFGIAPRIVARDNLKFWHTLGSALYLLQWLCVSGLLWRRLAPAPSSQG